jgi:hypothetical protein
MAACIAEQIPGSVTSYHVSFAPIELQHAAGISEQEQYYS